MASASSPNKSPTPSKIPQKIERVISSHQNIIELRNDLSELHKQLADANDKNGDMHKKLEGLHKEKILALQEVSQVMRRAENEASKRRQAESRVRNMESDLKLLANSNDTVKYFQEAEARRVQTEKQVMSLRHQLAELKRYSVDKSVKFNDEGGESAAENLNLFFSPIPHQTPHHALSPSEMILQSKVDVLSEDLLEVSEALLHEREMASMRMEEAIEVVQDAELTAEAAKELGAEEITRTNELRAMINKYQLMSEELSVKLESSRKQHGETELKLLEVSLENEALRTQLASNGIEPAPEQFTDSFHLDFPGDFHAAPEEHTKSAQHISRPHSPPSAHHAIQMEDMPVEGQVDTAWRRLRAYADEHGHMKAVELFKNFDQNSNGFIEMPEFEATLRAMGINNLSEEVICAVMKSADTNGDGTLDYLELAAKLKNK